MDPIILTVLYYAVAVMLLLTFWASRRSSKDAAELLLTREGILAAGRTLRSDLEALERADTDGTETWLMRERRQLKEAGVHGVTAAEYIAARVVTAVIVGGLVMLVTRSLAAALLAGFFAYSFPSGRLAARRERLRRLYETQLRKACRRMVSSSQAGLPLTEAIEQMSKILEAPLGAEFAYVDAKLKVGASLEEALAELEDRVPTEEIRMFSTALRVNQERGGVGFGDAMDLLAERLDNKERLRNTAAASTRQMKGSYYLVLLLVLGVGLVNYQRDATLYAPLLNDPAGQIATLFVTGIAYIGHRLIQARSKLEAAL